MRQRIALLLILFVTALSSDAQRRVILGNPGGADATKDWPKPQIRAGLAQAEALSSAAAYAKALADAGQFSGVLMVAKDGKPVMTRAYGLADVASKTPNTNHTKFNIGSLNKMFTKTAIAQLAQAGKLSLDDTIAKHLPALDVPSADKITIGQLIDHRSGMGDIFGPKYQAAPPSSLRELSDFVPLFAGQPLAFEPGSSQRYSNAGYLVLGLIVEKLSGQKYRDYIQQRVFTPAKMKNSGFWGVDETVAKRATGYTSRGQEDGKRVPNDSTLPGRPSSAGGAYSTADDLLAFFNAIVAGKLTEGKWTNWMLDAAPGAPIVRPGLALGGGAAGLNASVMMNDGWTVIALANYDPPAASYLGRGAMEIIRGEAEKVDEERGPAVRRAPPTAPERTEMNADVTVPIAMSEHMVTVEASINGKGPFRFVLDSGAGMMLRISTDLQKTLQLAQVGEVMAGDPSGKNNVARPVVHAESVSIGGARFLGVDASVGDARAGDQTSGVIGLALFGTLSVTVDYSNQQLRLTRAGVAADDPHAVPFVVEHGVPVISIDVAGTPMKVDVDSGSPAVLSVPSSWAARMPFASEPQVIGKGRTATNEFDIRAAELRGDLRVAGFARNAPRIDVVDIFPVANLGARFLRDYVVTFDMVNRRIKLAK